jgi:hypothetical protein
MSKTIEKATIAQRKFGVAMYGELIDGEKIIANEEYVENEIKAIILNLVEYVHKNGKTIGKYEELTLPEPQIADKVSEDLLSNLFPVLSFPTPIYSSPTYLRRVDAVFRKLGNDVENQPFLLKNKRLFTFDNLKKPSSVFAPIIER